MNIFSYLFIVEEQVYELFSRCGDVKRVVMGLDKFRKTPCGFCFVEYPWLKKMRYFYAISIPQIESKYSLNHMKLKVDLNART